MTGHFSLQVLQNKKRHKRNNKTSANSQLWELLMAVSGPLPNMGHIVKKTSQVLMHGVPFLWYFICEIWMYSEIYDCVFLFLLVLSIFALCCDNFQWCCVYFVFFFVRLCLIIFHRVARFV